MLISFFNSVSYFLLPIICVFLLSSAHLVSPIFSILKGNCKTAHFSKRTPISQTFASIISANHPSLSCTCLIFLHFKPGLQCVLVETQAIKKNQHVTLPDSDRRQTCELVQHRQTVISAFVTQHPF